jgi:hypothetical protein
MKVRFETLDEMMQWMDKASTTVLKDKSCEVAFVHRSNCAHVVGTQRSSADQKCPCRPRPVLAFQ